MNYLLSKGKHKRWQILNKLNFFKKLHNLSTATRASRQVAPRQVRRGRCAAELTPAGTDRRIPFNVCHPQRVDDEDRVVDPILSYVGNYEIIEFIYSHIMEFDIELI